PGYFFQAAFGLGRPRHCLFFGVIFFPLYNRTTDTDAPPAFRVAAAAPQAGEAWRALAPETAPVPRVRPSRASRQGGRQVAALTPESAAPRRPSAAAVAEAATRFDSGGAGAIIDNASLSPEEDIILLGVLLRRGDDRALIRTATGESRRVTLGDEVAGWRVSTIGADFIQLSRASQTREIRVPD
ncbi:MAG: hypothetical protein AAF909_08000, partial [Pseudomonadota bacterium]